MNAFFCVNSEFVVKLAAHMKKGACEILSKFCCQFNTQFHNAQLCIFFIVINYCINFDWNNLIYRSNICPLESSFKSLFHSGMDLDSSKKKSQKKNRTNFLESFSFNHFNLINQMLRSGKETHQSNVEHIVVVEQIFAKHFRSITKSIFI